MKYPAIVVYNNQDDSSIPSAGCIKVVAPTLLGFRGFITEKEKGIKDKWIEKLMKSDWVRPCYSHPKDFYLPEIGEGVYIEYLGNSTKLIYTGFFPASDFENQIIDKTPAIKMAGINKNATVEKNKNKTRVFGTRYGSYILFDDTWAEQTFTKSSYKKSGKLIICAGGPNTKFPDRKGITVSLDTAEDAEKYELVIQSKDGKYKQSIVVDATKDKPKISFSSLNANDKGLKEIIIDNDTDCIKSGGKNKNDKGEQSVLLDFANALIKLAGKDSNDANEMSLLLDFANKKIEMSDSGSQKIAMDASSGSENISLTGKSGDFIRVKNGEVNLNGNTEAAVKGTTLCTAFITLCTAIALATSGSMANNASGIETIKAAFSAFNGQVETFKSTKTKLG